MAETDTAVAEPETTQAEPTPVEQDTDAIAAVDTEGEADEEVRHLLGDDG